MKSDAASSSYKRSHNVCIGNKANCVADRMDVDVSWTINKVFDRSRMAC